MVSGLMPSRRNGKSHNRADNRKRSGAVDAVQEAKAARGVERSGKALAKKPEERYQTAKDM